MTGNPYSGLGAHRRDPRQARDASDLAASAPHGESARAGRHAGRHRRRLRHQGLRHRRRLLARTRRDQRRTAGSRSIAITSRWATASARRSPTASRCISAASPTRSRSRAIDSLRRARARHFGRSVHDGPEDPGRRGEESALGAGDQLRRPAPRSARMSARMRRRKPRASIFRFGLWPAALELWGIATTDPRAKDLAKARWKDGQLIVAGPAAARAAGARRDRACAQPRHRRDGARLLALGLGARALPAWRARTGAPRSTRSRVRKGGGKFERLDRASASGFRRPTTTASASRSPRCAARSCASRSSARPARCASPRPTACSNAARRWCRRSCCGQAQGGFAMGVGYALLETLPPYEGGPGNGAMESRPVPDRARLGPAAARSRDRDAAAARRRRSRRRAWRRS